MHKKDLQETAAHIKACDLSRPYYYICYSTQEGAEVYAAVRHLLEAGANLWIDTEANLMQGDGYNSSIFAALRAKNCCGLIFFMSQAAMTSAQCAKEMAYLKSEPFLADHDAQFPIIIVEMEEIPEHDDEVWVEGLLYQKYQADQLSPAESERIQKYRDKYNAKIGRMTTKFHVAESILPFLLAHERGRIAYDAANRADELKRLMTY